MYPIEVKSGANYSTTSLIRFKEKYKSRIGRCYIIHLHGLSVKEDMRDMGSVLELYVYKVCRNITRHRASELGIEVIDLEDLEDGKIGEHIKTLMKTD